MEVRRPEMDFSNVEPHWSRNRELAQFYNAASTVPSHIEPYLVRLMVRAQAEIQDPALRADIEVFNKQEVEHCTRHNAFNLLLRSRYPAMVALEKALAGDFRSFFQKKSLRFNLAYAEGFEAMGSGNAAIFFEVLPLLERSADPKALELWKWHLAEEFEHRHVCFDVYRALYGKGPTRGYFYRCYGYLYAFLHLSRHMNRVADLLLAHDRATMTPEQVAKSKAREKSYRRMTRLRDIKQTLTVLSPFYNPSKKPMSAAMREYLEGVPASAA
jgi:uncharacterized protein